MRIGIDIDNTITDTSVLINELLMERKDIKLDADFDNYNENQLSNYENLIRDNIDFVMENCPLRNNVKEVIDYLKNKGHEIYIITARDNHYSPNIYKITLDYLNKHGIIYDEFLFGYHNKKDICIEKKIDIMLDDNIEVITSLKNTKVNGILYSSGYNDDYEGLKVNSWLEFKKYVEGDSDKDGR